MSQIAERKFMALFHIYIRKGKWMSLVPQKKHQSIEEKKTDHTQCMKQMILRLQEPVSRTDIQQPGTSRCIIQYFLSCLTATIKEYGQISSIPKLHLSTIFYKPNHVSLASSFCKSRFAGVIRSFLGSVDEGMNLIIPKIMP
jgi:hypothetical protein